MNLNVLKNIKINGRYLIENNNLYFYHVGSGITFKMKGNSFTIDLGFLDKKGFIYLVLDHDLKNKQKIHIENPQKLDIKMPDLNEHLVDIIKCNEEQDNTLVLNDLFIDGKSLKFKEKNKINIKVYGDSTICGYGILKQGGENATYLDNDGVEDFCFDCLYNLGAKINVFAHSGWGLIFSEYTVPKTEGILHKKDNVSAAKNYPWKDKRKYDLLIISLGTNDLSYINANPEKKKELEDQFVSSYLNLIKDERSKNKNIPILMVYGTLKEDYVYPLIEKTYKEAIINFNNIYIHKFDGDNSGISHHAYVKKHVLMSKELEKQVKEILG